MHPTSLRGAAEKRTEWTPASFHGIAIGTATRADVERAFGNPVRVDRVPIGDGSFALDLVYPTIDPLGVSIITIDSTTSIVIHAYVEVRGTALETIVERFGEDYTIGRYSPDPRTDKEAVPIGLIEDPDGEIEYLEFRKVGVAISLDTTGTPRYVQYYAKPIAGEREPCK
jgi:hypothetical protein